MVTFEHKQCFLALALALALALHETSHQKSTLKYHTTVGIYRLRRNSDKVPGLEHISLQLEIDCYAHIKNIQS